MCLFFRISQFGVKRHILLPNDNKQYFALTLFLPYLIIRKHSALAVANLQPVPGPLAVFFGLQRLLSGTAFRNELLKQQASSEVRILIYLSLSNVELQQGHDGKLSIRAKLLGRALTNEAILSDWSATRAFFRKLKIQSLDPLRPPPPD